MVSTVSLMVGGMLLTLKMASPTFLTSFTLLQNDAEKPFFTSLFASSAPSSPFGVFFFFASSFILGGTQRRRRCQERLRRMGPSSSSTASLSYTDVKFWAGLTEGLSSGLPSSLSDLILVSLVSGSVWGSGDGLGVDSSVSAMVLFVFGESPPATPGRRRSIFSDFSTALDANSPDSRSALVASNFSRSLSLALFAASTATIRSCLVFDSFS